MRHTGPGDVGRSTAARRRADFIGEGGAPSRRRRGSTARTGSRSPPRASTTCTRASSGFAAVTRDVVLAAEPLRGDGRRRVGAPVARCRSRPPSRSAPAPAAIASRGEPTARTPVRAESARRRARGGTLRVAGDRRSGRFQGLDVMSDAAAEGRPTRRTPRRRRCCRPASTPTRRRSRWQLAGNGRQVQTVDALLYPRPAAVARGGGRRHGRAGAARRAGGVRGPGGGRGWREVPGRGRPWRLRPRRRVRAAAASAAKASAASTAATSSRARSTTTCRARLSTRVRSR